MRLVERNGRSSVRIRYPLPLIHNQKNTNMAVLNIDGTDARSALSKEQKEHHPDRVMKRRQQLAKTLSGLQEGWNQDSGEDPLGATKPNIVSIDRHYDTRWREECSVANAAQEAVDADGEAMATWIAEQRESRAKMERWNLPLHKLNDLEEFQFKLVGECPEGTMWLSSHIALCVAENGEVVCYIFRRRDDWKLQPWRHLLSKHRSSYCIHELFRAIDYTPHELFALLGAMRVDKITWPTEHTMERARNTEVPSVA